MAQGLRHWNCRELFNLLLKLLNENYPNLLIYCLLLFLHLPDLVRSFSFSSSDRTVIWFYLKYRREILIEQFCLPELLLTIQLSDPGNGLTLFYARILHPAGHRILCVLMLSLLISAVPGFFYIKNDHFFFPLSDYPILHFQPWEKSKK